MLLSPHPEKVPEQWVALLEFQGITLSLSTTYIVMSAPDLATTESIFPGDCCDHEAAFNIAKDTTVVDTIIFSQCSVGLEPSLFQPVVNGAAK